MRKQEPTASQLRRGLGGGQVILETPETGPSATESQDPARVGLCDCPERRVHCTCEWAALINRLEQVAYHTPFDQALVELPHLQMQLNVRLSELRKAALRQAAAEWTGSIAGFLKRFELTRSNYDRLGLKVHKGY